MGGHFHSLLPAKAIIRFWGTVRVPMVLTRCRIELGAKWLMHPLEVSREELYEQVWTTPVNLLAKKFNVSGSYLARICSALNVPRPPVGYWQKKAVGKAETRPSLPAAQPGDQLIWSKDAGLTLPAKPHAWRKPRDMAAARPVGSGRHPLLMGVEKLFRKSRKVEEGEFLRPYKWLLPDIVAAESELSRALDLASQIYRALDDAGHRVLIAPQSDKLHRIDIEEREVPQKDRKYGRHSLGVIWSPFRPTVTYIGIMPVGIALTEMTERVTLRYLDGKYVREESKAAKSARSWQLTHSWTTEQDLPCGRFRLVAYSPLAGVNWVQSWQETKQGTLASMISAFIRKLEGSLVELERLKIAAEESAARWRREREEEWERYQRKEDQQKVAEALLQSKRQLAEVIDKWATATSVERFFAEAERRLEEAPTGRRAELQERLTLARAMVGSLDPLDFLQQWKAPGERYKSKYEQE